MGDSAAAKDLDFWSFIELAKSRLGAQFGAESVLATEVLLTLNRASLAVTYDLESTVHRPRGLSWASFRLLFVAWIAGPLESKQAAELAGMTRAAVSNLTRSLVDDQLLKRTPGAQDGRSVQLSLTPEGQRLMRSVFSEQTVREQEWVDVLTQAERHILILLLNKLIAGRSDFNIRRRS
ncbi:MULTISPECIES: MarR family winged helix-turn-helix transcriptional regulator [unclassified Mycolicibacterium]|uniref:MarR family winged helix-turn-helix transcriptional regulator n=1 Tax=unclassified Mycolicibacterium TaxID=2636767 RepID=UPI002EDA6881